MMLLYCRNDVSFQGTSTLTYQRSREAEVSIELCDILYSTEMIGGAVLVTSHVVFLFRCMNAERCVECPRTFSYAVE